MDIAAVISDDEAEEKTGIFFPSMFPALSVVDPDLMMSVPADFTAYQGMDAFFRASESVVNKNEFLCGAQGGDITADPLSLSDEDYLAIFEKAYR